MLRNPVCYPEELLVLFTDICTSVAAHSADPSKVDPQRYLQCSDQLFKLFDELQTTLGKPPTEFLLHAFQTAASDLTQANNQAVVGTSLKLLMT
jgi:hypothetical protein